MEPIEKTADKNESKQVMKAVRLHEFGGPEVLRYEDAPIPELKAGEVLVRVHAIGINPPDWYLREGYKMLPPEWRPNVPFPIIPGSDISGVVAAVAGDVKNFSVGDEVFGMVRFPSYGDSAAYAEYVAAPASDLALKPAVIDHVHAGAAPMSLLTAWQFMIELGHNVQNPLQPNRHEPVPLEGKTVLVNGAAGGVGHFAVQIAKWKGARVIAVGSSTQGALLRDLGADEFIDYTKTSAEDTLSGIDLVIDSVGGPTTGRAGKLGVIVSATQVRSNGPQLAEIGRLLDTGTIRVIIDSTFPLADADKAHERAARGNIQGKIVLTSI
jgi:NADPH:quinone reductase-like Zn-dependent oxidoreductase